MDIEECYGINPDYLADPCCTDEYNGCCANDTITDVEDTFASNVSVCASATQMEIIIDSFIEDFTDIPDTCEDYLVAVLS